MTIDRFLEHCYIGAIEILRLDFMILIGNIILTNLAPYILTCCCLPASYHIKKSEFLVSIVFKREFTLLSGAVISKLSVFVGCVRDKTEPEAELTEDQKMDVQQKENARSAVPGGQSSWGSVGCACCIYIWMNV